MDGRALAGKSSPFAQTNGNWGFCQGREALSAFALTIAKRLWGKGTYDASRDMSATGEEWRIRYQRLFQPEAAFARNIDFQVAFHVFFWKFLLIHGLPLSALLMP